MWPSHRQEFLGDPAVWRNDPAVTVLAPGAAEDSSHVPFLIDATAVTRPIRRIVVTIDYSPFPKAIVFHPGRALPLLGFGVKYEVGGALRASAETGAGEWLVGAAYVSALGGGCSAPAAAHQRPDWQEGFGELRARLWPETGRLRMRLRHPQDTGLADGIPGHHLTELALLDASGAEIATLELHEPLEENPALTFLLPPIWRADRSLSMPATIWDTPSKARWRPRHDSVVPTCPSGWIRCACPAATRLCPAAQLRPATL
ncbi:quinoprotein dehydrogenase-associated SoxYZ-like carrier [Paracoccus kondratievae]